MATEIAYEASDYQSFPIQEEDVSRSASPIESDEFRQKSSGPALQIEQDDVRQKIPRPVVHIEGGSVVYTNENFNSANSSTSLSQSSEEDEEENKESVRDCLKYKAINSFPIKTHRSSPSLNSHNNKGKSVFHDRTNKKTVTFTDSYQGHQKQKKLPRYVAQRRTKFALMGPRRSFQVSSIRDISAIKGSSVGRGVSKHMGYGQRLIEKNGKANILDTGIDRVELCSRYFSDIFTTLLDSHWIWVLLTTAVVYVGHWFIFGLLYWLFAIWNNDYEKIILSKSSSSHDTNLSDPCVYEVYDGISAFLFSMESETTIGYGKRTISTACPAAVTCLTFQCIIAAIFDTWVIGLCFAKFARPDARTNTTMFSRQAVICTRDGKKYLLVRFANLRKSLLLSVSVRARLITLRTAQSEEKNIGFQGMLEQRQVTFENESSALLTAPIEYRHVIDEDSPFCKIEPGMYNCMNDENYFELIFIVTGTLESTGLTMQAQTSFLSTEILHGYRFVPIISKSQQKYVVDFAHFHDTIKEQLVNSNPEEKNSHIRKICTRIDENKILSTDDESSSDEVDPTLVESPLRLSDNIN